MRCVKHNDISSLDGLDDIRFRHQIARQRDSLEIFDIFMLFVDDIGQVSVVDDFVVHPHVDGRLEKMREGGRVFGNDLGDSCAPIEESVC